MKSDLVETKKEIGIALGINFVLIGVLGVLLFTLPKRESSYALITLAANLFMIIPCFASMVTMKYVTKESFNKKEENFVKWIIIATAILYLVTIIALVGRIEDFGLLIPVVQMGISLVLIRKVLKNGKDLERFNLRLSKNKKWIFKTAGIFIAIKLLLIVISILTSTEEITINTMLLAYAPISLVENFFLGFFMFFGEEFGWRYYLQPRLQLLFGKKLGVIILGAIWGIWHLPLCFTLYSPETPIYCVINHVIFCITLGIFLGFVYMRTENIFAPIVIHLINNVTAVLLNNGSYESTIDMQTLIMGAVINIITFGIFILDKTYKEDKKDNIKKLEPEEVISV